mmetsp:Transcript_1523/g.1598  ORF Transcript_1523/g.1598 Transcript_1523/m.1598 type:complete len:347 (+) Transcript_1523:84-1124(+)
MEAGAAGAVIPLWVKFDRLLPLMARKVFKMRYSSQVFAFMSLEDEQKIIFNGEEILVLDSRTKCVVQRVEIKIGNLLTGDVRLTPDGQKLCLTTGFVLYLLDPRQGYQQTNRISIRNFKVDYIDNDHVICISQNRTNTLRFDEEIWRRAIVSQERVRVFGISKNYFAMMFDQPDTICVTHKEYPEIVNSYKISGRRSVWSMVISPNEDILAIVLEGGIEFRDFPQLGNEPKKMIEFKETHNDLVFFRSRPQFLTVMDWTVIVIWSSEDFVPLCKIDIQKQFPDYTIEKIALSHFRDTIDLLIGSRVVMSIDFDALNTFLLLLRVLKQHKLIYELPASLFRELCTKY